ncbi:MAG TPA: tRNA (adenosine(37)-N6)-threonylcarbamoyltransferase complex ATPase subunit type 1 TsaE [Flavisolibacter sp.]|nr:tRNA (adenosine(37)-N6)-threonylcarbamoyltransferase complex ATPase subunit type 1 TsaE [Flavisolibacter sp.]
MLEIISLDQLDNFAKRFWDNFPDGKVVAFYGNMGAGKTTLITALCKVKGVKEVIGSPTFSIINEYGFLYNGSEQIIYHMDLYRLNSIEEIIRAGVEDCLVSGEICMVEWAEKAPELFDERAIKVFIEPVNDTERKIQVAAPIYT